MTLYIENAMSLMKRSLNNLFEFIFVSFYTRYVYQSKIMSPYGHLIFLVGFGEIMPSVSYNESILFPSILVKQDTEGLNNSTFTCIRFSKKCNDKVIPNRFT